MVIDTVAGLEEVLKKAKELIDLQGIEISEEEIEDIYFSTVDYIKKSIEESDAVALYMPKLGTAYYTLQDLSKIRKGRKKDSEIVKKVERQKADIDEYYQENQTGKKGNRKDRFRIRHIEKNFTQLNKKHGYSMEKIEKIQNDPDF